MHMDDLMISEGGGVGRKGVRREQEKGGCKGSEELVAVWVHKFSMLFK